MRRLKDFLKSKGFYIALGTGIVAFAALMMVYNYSVTKDDLTREQAIDLNQPVNEEEIEDAQQEDMQTAEKDTADKTAKNEDKETEPAGSDGVIKNEDEETEIVENTEAANNEIVNTEATETETTDEAAATEGTDTETLDAENTENTETSEDTVTVTSDEAEADTAEDDTMTAGLEYNGEQTLSWPLVGNVILPYSMDTTVYFQTLDVYKCNPGMMIDGEEGADVLAAYEGIVASVEDDKEFGTIVRVDMGNGYEAVYGQLMNVCVSEGDTVSMAQNIGEVAPASSYYSEEGNHLYFAVTKDGEPVNPMSLIK